MFALAVTTTLVSAPAAKALAEPSAASNTRQPSRSKRPMLVMRRRVAS